MTSAIRFMSTWRLRVNKQLLRLNIYCGFRLELSTSDIIFYAGGGGPQRPYSKAVLHIP
jgi:hypothetical protein